MGCIKSNNMRKMYSNEHLKKKVSNKSLKFTYVGTLQNPSRRCSGTAVGSDCLPPKSVTSKARIR